MGHRTTIEKVRSHAGFAIAFVDGARFRIRQKEEGPELVVGDEIELRTLGTMGGFIEAADWTWCDPERRAADEAKRQAFQQAHAQREATLEEVTEALPIRGRIVSMDPDSGVVLSSDYGEFRFQTRDTYSFVPEVGDEVEIEEVLHYSNSLQVYEMSCPAKPWWTHFTTDLGKEFLAWAQGDEADWLRAIEQARHSRDKSKPSRRWLQESQSIVTDIGEDAFVDRLLTLFPNAFNQPPAEYNCDINSDEQDLLKGLAWMCTGLSDPRTPSLLGQLADAAYKKIPGTGETATRVGNACVNSLATLQDGQGIAQLSRLLGKVRTASARKTIEKALNAAAESTGQTRADIEEVAIPSFGISLEAPHRQALGDFWAELAIEGTTAVLRWRKTDGKVQKSIPKAVGESHAEELGDLKRSLKELKALLASQSPRLERMWIADRRLSVADLYERYLRHPVVAPTARRLAWTVESQAGAVATFWRDGKLRGLGGADVNIQDSDEARLLHPIDLEAEELAIWRDFIEENDIVQPFPQFWREVYVADAANSYREQFAGHVIHQQSFRRLCQERGWVCPLQGMWDGYQEQATKTVEDATPSGAITAALELSATSFDLDEYLAEYVVSGEMSFRSSDETNFQPIAGTQLSPMLFSELVRDVDTFVSRCTIINNADFRAADITDIPGLELHDWSPLGAIHQTRAEVLRRTIPRTILRDKATIVEPALQIKGTAGTFEIHLGTTKVREQGQKEFIDLRIDKKEREKVRRIFLPFEGDNMLSEVLAKAIILAESAEGQ